MTIFGAKIIFERECIPTFKFQGKVYHLISFLLPLTKEEPQYFQLYFLSDLIQEAQKSVDATRVTKRDTLIKPQDLLHEWKINV